MSIKLMAAAWEMDIPQTEKMVLLCLCDHANDNGVCWPSVASMARKCSVSERSVQRAIRALRNRKIVTWDDAPGRVHKFVIDPRRIVTPDTVSPLTESHPTPDTVSPTPDTVSPKPSITVKEPSIKARAVARPADVTVQVWADFQSARRAQRAPVTETALQRIRSEAAKAGWSLEDALAEMVARAWRGFKADWVKDRTDADPEYCGP